VENRSEEAEAARAEAEAKAAAEEKEPVIEDLLDELPLSEKSKKMVAALLGGLASNLTQINKRIEAMESSGDSTAPELFDGLSPEQKYNILMAKYAAPAQAAQSGIWELLLSRAGGGGGGGEIDTLLKSGEKIKALRDAFSPEPSAVQVAMEKANVAQVIAQTRLMNKVAGKQTDSFLDNISKDLGSDGSESTE